MKLAIRWAILCVLFIGVSFVGSTFIGCGASYTSEETEREIIEKEDAEDPEPEPEFEEE